MTIEAEALCSIIAEAEAEGVYVVLLPFGVEAEAEALDRQYIMATRQTRSLAVNRL